MQIVAGLFMLATAFNMLNIHPIFRYFVVQPPKALIRLLRNQAKSEALIAPSLLGPLTVLITCGTTQAMAIITISSGNPFAGALIMGVFTLLMDCAQICAASQDFMLRNSPHHSHICGECAEICTKCAEDCEWMANGDQEMMRCAESRRRYAESCQMTAHTTA